MIENDHVHCPLGCDHPQAFYYRTLWEEYETERYICGVCYWTRKYENASRGRVLTEMQICSPEIC